MKRGVEDMETVGLGDEMARGRDGGEGELIKDIERKRTQKNKNVLLPFFFGVCSFWANLLFERAALTRTPLFLMEVFFLLLLLMVFSMRRLH